MGRRYRESKSQKIKFIAMGAILLIAVSLMVFLGYKAYKYIKSPKPQQKTVSETVINPLPKISPSDINLALPEPPNFNNPSDDVRGVWIASVLNIDYPSKQGLGASELKKEIDDIVATTYSAGLNAVFFQVRPTADALYKSEIFPTSHWLTGKQGKELADGFDPLAYMVEVCHKKNVKLHIWINPYRVTNSADFTNEMLSEKSPARLHSDWVIKHSDGKLYFNPGLSEVRQLVTDGVMEIVNKYDIDGVHFDDYFYPSESFADEDTFKKYGTSFKTKADWRRENNNLLIKNTYDAIKKVKPNVLFGVSPFGIWANKAVMADGSDTTGTQSYVDHYADSKKWVKEGTVDYICPQLYWGFDQKGQNFNVLCDWWADVVKGTKVKLYIGHAPYKLAKDDKIYNKADEITKQIAYAKKKEGYGGSVFYGYKSIKGNLLGVKDYLFNYFSTTNKQNKLFISQPVNKTAVYTENCFVIGASNAFYPLTVNGKAVEDRTSSGYFSLYLPLKVGENSFTLLNGTDSLSLTIIRKQSAQASEYMSKFEIKNVNPDDNRLVRLEGEEINISATAPAGATVYAMMDGQKIDLVTGSLPPSNGKLLAASYVGKVTLPSKADGKIVSLGKIKFYAKSGSKTAEYESKSEIKVQSAAYKILGTVSSDYTFLRPAPQIQNFFESFPTYKGLSDYITGEEYIYDNRLEKNSLFVRLSCGLWVQKENVKVEEKTQNLSEISAITLENTEKFTVLALKCEGNYPCTVNGFSDRVEANIFNVLGENGPLPTMVENPLFSGASCKREGNKIVYTFSLKKEDLYLGYKILYENGKMSILFRNPIRFVSKDKPLTGIKIALDAGHGTTPGAYGPYGTNGLLEKDMNYQMVLSTKKYLESFGATVLLSREETGGREVREIVPFYQEASPDLALSIHHNSLDFGGNPIENSGAESFFASQQTKKAAEIILDNACSYAKREKRFTKKVDYIVSRYHECPAVLLEAGYMSNIYEYEWLSYEQNRDYYGHSIALAIVDYFKWQNS